MVNRNPQPKPHAEPSDGELVRRFRDGDTEALETFFERHTPAMRRRALRILGAAPDADDAVQEACLRALGAIGRVSPEREIARWLIRIVTNVARDLARSRGRRAVLMGDVSDAVGFPSTERPADVHLEGEERRRIVWGTLDRLRARDAQLLIRRHILGEKPRDISCATGIPSGRISTRLTRARYAFERHWPTREPVAAAVVE